MADFEIKNGVAVIPEGVTAIDDCAFKDCSSLQSITIPEGVTWIGSNAFSRCSSLQSIVVAKGNPKYDSHEGCNAIIETATSTLIAGCPSTIIPEGVTAIGWYAFYGCSSLQSIVVAKGNPKYDSREGCNAIIETATNKLIVGCPSTTIPEGVTEIGGYAFARCSSLQSITIPEGVTEIGWNAFENCSSLQSIVVAKGNPKYDSREGCNAIIETATNTLIVGCPSTTIPEGVTEIGGYAFARCSSLQSITIPNGVTKIGWNAFEGCSSLQSITIPESVTEISYYAFEGCSSLQSITIPESVTEIGGRAFACCRSLQSITIPESVTKIGGGAFSGCHSLQSIVIPKGVKKIEEFAFSGCTVLTTVTLPIGVNKINEGVFTGCKALSTIYVPAKKTDYYKRRLPEELHSLIVELQPAKKAKKK